MEPAVSVIIPVFREQDVIADTLDAIAECVKTSHELLVVYDFESDPTLSIVREHRFYKTKAIRLIKNRGNGVIGAMKTGFAMARGKAIVQVAADLADDPAIVDEMYRKIAEDYMIVSASRYTRGGRFDAPLNLKTGLSRLAGYLGKYLLGVPLSDITYAFKMYRKEIFEKVEIESRGGFEYAMEICLKARKLNLAMCEIPSISADRKAGKSKFRLGKWLPSYARWYAQGIWWNLGRG